MRIGAAKLGLEVKLLVIFFMMILSVNSYSVDAEGQVERIYPTGDKVYFRLKGDSCKSTPANTYWHFSLLTDEGKAWFAMLLSASATKTKIKLGVPSCDASSDSYINYIYQDFE